MKAKLPPKRNAAARLQRLARERADEQARHISWQRLYEARNLYIDWQEFSLWVRSVSEAEERLPVWLDETIQQRCPGFLADLESGDGKPFAIKLEDWVDEHIFGFAKQGGWFDAIAYYAVRDPRYRRAEVCWSESVEKWRRCRPIRYPSFEEWKARASECDDTAHLVADERAARQCTKLVDSERLADAVDRYIDWEAFAYWARPALEHRTDAAEAVPLEVERRCPGFLSTNLHELQPAMPTATISWHVLMDWIGERFFSDAKQEGWFDAILIAARNHPRAVRTMEYADHCDETWTPRSLYPDFTQWRQLADAYIETGTE